MAYRAFKQIMVKGMIRLHIYLIDFHKDMKKTDITETKLEVIKETDQTYYTESKGLIKSRYLKTDMDKIISNVKTSFPLIEYNVATLNGCNNYAELFTEAAEICFPDMVEVLEKKFKGKLENRKKRRYDR